MPTKLFYSPDYNLRLLGLEKLHPFDGAKYGRAMKLLATWLGDGKVNEHLCRVTDPVPNEDLLLAHSPSYLSSLKTSEALAVALEFGALKHVPNTLLSRTIVRSMRLAVQGTIMATREALESGLAVNVSGGYHHASRDSGGGFCLFGDAYIAIQKMRAEGRLAADASILYVDLDAHQGNGFERLCLEHRDQRVFIYDQFNTDIYPQDAIAAQRINLGVELRSGMGDEAYLTLLHNHLPEAIAEARPALAIYNAGSDVYCEDALGGLALSDHGIALRDRYVLEALHEAGIPTTVVLSGGYSDDSHRHVAALLSQVITNESQTVSARLNQTVPKTTTHSRKEAE